MKQLSLFSCYDSRGKLGLRGGGWHAQSHTAVSREPEFKSQRPDLALGLPPHYIVDFPQARVLSSFGGLTHSLQNFLSLWYLGQRSLKGDPDQMTTVSVSPRVS